MKRILFLVLFSWLLAIPGLAQNNPRYDGVVQSRAGWPAPGATVAVCSQPAVTSTTPCTPLVPLCLSASDGCSGAQGGGGTAANPLTADGLGNYHFYLKNGQCTLAASCTIQFYGSGLTTSFMGDQSFGGLAAIPAASVIAAGTTNHITIYTAPTTVGSDSLLIDDGHELIYSGDTGLEFNNASFPPLIFTGIAGQGIAIQGSDGGASQSGGTMTLKAGSGGSNGPGGAVNIFAGTPSGSTVGGSILLETTGFTAGGAAGDITLQAGVGNGATNGGNVFIKPSGNNGKIIQLSTVENTANHKPTLAMVVNSVGTWSMTPSVTTGTWTWTPPTSGGSAGQYMQTDGTGATSWQTVNVPAAASAFTWSCYWSSNLTGTINICQWTPRRALTIRQMTMILGTQSSGCAGGAVVAVYDNTSSSILTSLTTTNSTGQFDSGNALNIAATSGHQLEIAVTTGATGCGTPPANAMIVVQYD